MMSKEEFLNRTFMFGIKVFHLVEKFPESKGANVIANQILRSSSSVGANHRATYRAKSKADFSYKVKIVLEEVDESLFWLEYTKKLNLLKKDNHEELEFLIKEADELTRIFASAQKNSRN